MMPHFLKRLFGISRQDISSSGRTDTGRLRSHNEDDYCILTDRNIFVVADGMGGHNAGEVASRAAIETLNAYFSKKATHKIKGKKEEIRHFIIKGFYHINDVVMEMAEKDASRGGMGCTLVSGLLDGSLLHTCHVGDSRCYIGDEKGLAQVTTDHSMVAACDEKQNSGNSRHVITRAIGFPFSEDPEYHCREIRPGNRLLFCSDGLWSMMDDKQIHEVLFGTETPEHASNLLVQKANQAGGTDNITAVVVFC